ncbi:spinster family MFS transporter [Sphingomonas canadensis]|uniref:Spinster family MFS transporter n=1 Tax=Sphingomonas canadensis TaxID=1219257 RepID=A0ABW3HBI8_9SPHN|nr:MFS transporter [Sphingomonas canadensis]MCW3837340.1 MFS transporter [Sphingomonas canadensis]
MDDATPATPQRAGGYAWYVLGVLFLVYVLNFIDRQILAILADDIKRDLGLTDGDIGFLYGTAFGVFYALFGIPLGRLADSWRRVRLMSLGLALWSAMTALSGFARTGLALAGARIGVGVGEATASPAAYSLISDWFPRRLRATALAIYSAGIYVGGGLSLFIGGAIVERWDAAYPAHSGPMGLAGWQAAFLAVGVPGLLVAVLVATLREPMRGQSEGLLAPPDPAPFKGFVEELLTVIPPFTLLGAARRGIRALAANVAVLAMVGAAVMVLVVGLGEPLLQWAAVGVGVYAVFSWGAALRQRDPPSFALILGSRAFLAVVLAYGLNAFLAYAVAAFAPSFARREFGISADEVGLMVGLPAAVAGLLGVTLGGRIADRLRERHPAGRVAVVIFGSVAPVPAVALAFTADTPALFYAMIPLAQLLASSALGASAAATQDLVLPRMRGTATAAFFIGTTLIGLALGPYLAGRISYLSGSLATGILALLVTVPVALAAAIAAWRLLPEAEASRQQRARAAGEPL